MVLSREKLMEFWTPENREQYKAVYKKLGESEKTCFTVKETAKGKQVSFDADCIKKALKSGSKEIGDLWA